MLGIRGGQLARERSCVSTCKMEADCGGLFVKVGVVVVVVEPFCQRRCCCRGGLKIGVVFVVVAAFLSRKNFLSK